MDKVFQKFLSPWRHGHRHGGRTRNRNGRRQRRRISYRKPGCTYDKWCEVSYREVSYEYALNDLMQKREQLISNLNQSVQVPVFLKQGEVCWIKGDVKDSLVLFENYLWYSKQKRKWVWLQEFNGMKQILLNPYCAIHEKIDVDTIVVDVEGKYLPKSYY